MYLELLRTDDFKICISDISELLFSCFLVFVVLDIYPWVVIGVLLSVYSIILYPCVNGLINTRASHQQQVSAIVALMSCGL